MTSSLSSFGLSPSPSGDDVIYEQPLSKYTVFHQIHNINALLSQNVSSRFTHFFRTIFLCPKVYHRQFVPFLDVRQYLCQCVSGKQTSGRHLVRRHFVLRKMQKIEKSLQRSPKSAKSCHKLPNVSLRIPQN